MNKNNEIIILHISDLHRTPGAELSNEELWESLRHDVWNGYDATNKELSDIEPRLPDPGEIDVVVVSGDLTQQAEAKEFVECEGFLQKIVDELLGRNKERLVLVPGNHDVDWTCSKEAYEPAHTTEFNAKQAFDHHGSFRVKVSDLTLWKRKSDKAAYDRRFGSFSNFFANFYGNKDKYKFPVDRSDDQFVIFDEFTNDLGIVIVGFNSCYLNDHLWHRGSIRKECLLRAAGQLDRLGYKEGGPLRIAVWHHNVLGSPQKSDFMDPRTTFLLAERGFSLGLHGHVHEFGRIEMLARHVRIPIVWAGSMCAGSNERPSSIPYLYNVIGLNMGSRTGWVHVRRRDDDWSVWAPHWQFKGGKSWDWLPSPHFDSSVTQRAPTRVAKPKLYSVHDAAEIVDKMIDTAMNESDRVEVLNLALDMAVTWPRVRDRVFLHSNITWNSLIVDLQAEAIDVFQRDLGVSVGDKDRLAATVRDIQLYCQQENRNMNKKNIKFHCRAYRAVPVLHGYLINRTVLLVSLCGVEKGCLRGARNPYLHFNKNTDEDTEMAQKLIEIFYSWFSLYWDKGVHIWPQKRAKKSRTMA